MTRALLVLVTGAACTAAPAMLPQKGPPALCDFQGGMNSEPTRRTTTSVGGVLGRVWISETDSDRIGWFDPVTLKPKTPYRAALPEQTSVWAVSPDGRSVAVEDPRGVRTIDAETLRATGISRGVPVSMSWLSEELLAGITRDGEAVTWDAHGRRIRTLELHGMPITSYAASDRLIALVTPHVMGRRSSSLIEIGASGIHTIDLERIAAGYDGDRGAHGTQLTPGLAYDPAGRRAFVVPPDGPIAEVDLVTRTVTHREPRSSFLDLVASSLVPRASAKLSGWATTRAVWLGEGLLAVSGDTGDILSLEGGSAGVAIIDTRDWSTCVLEERPTHLAVTGGKLLAWGGSDFGEFAGTGLIGYNLSDGNRWHLFGRQFIDVQVYGRYAYVINSWHGWRVATVDLSTGTVIARTKGRPPTVLPTGSSMQGW